MNTRTSKAVALQRAEIVLKLKLAGASMLDIKEFAAEEDPETGRPWKVCPRTLWRYQAHADRLLKRSLEKDRDKLLIRHLGQRRHLYARAVEANDLRTALAILDSEAELLSLFPAKRTSNGVPAGSITLNVTEIVVDNRQAHATGQEKRLSYDHANDSNANGVTNGVLENDPPAPCPASLPQV